MSGGTRLAVSASTCLNLAHPSIVSIRHIPTSSVLSTLRHLDPGSRKTCPARPLIGERWMTPNYLPTEISLPLWVVQPSTDTVLKETKKSRYKARRKLLSTQYHTGTCTLPQLHAVSSSTIQVQLHQLLVTSDWDKREPSTLTFCSAPIQFADSTFFSSSLNLTNLPVSPRHSSRTRAIVTP